MTYTPGYAGILLSCCLLAGGRLEAADPVDVLAPANAPAFQYFGAWQDGSEGCYTIYAGSQIRFGLKGEARLGVHSGLPGSVRAMVRKDGAVVWDGLLGQGDIEIDGGEGGAVFSIVYLATDWNGFDPSQPGAQAVELHFNGLSLGPGAVLQPSPEARSDVLVDFIGDSITAGFCISGRSVPWQEGSDASLTYAFRLAEKLETRYRIRGFSGETLGTIAPQIPYFRKGISLPSDESPDLVFVNVGANDRGESEASYRAGMRYLLNNIFTANPRARVILLNFHRMTPNRLPMLKELAKSFPEGAVACFDARPYLVGYSDAGVHPDAESHRLLANALYDYVIQKRLLEPLTTGAESTGVPNVQGAP